MGTTLLVYGPPATGKTQFVLELCIQMATEHKIKTAICSPETGVAHRIYEKILQMVVQKDLVPTYGNQMSLEEKTAAEAWVNEHFIVIEKPKNEKFTLERFYAEVDTIERALGIKIGITVADHFGEFYIDWNKTSRDLVLQERILYLRDNAETTGRYNIVVTHVVNQQKVVRKGVFSYYPPPDPQETANGQEWFRLSYAMIGLWRPPTSLNDPDTGEPYEDNCTVVLFGKQKPEEVKKQGSKIKRVNYYWDARRHRYYYKNQVGDNKYPKRIINEVQDRETVDSGFDFTENQDENPFA